MKPLDPHWEEAILDHLSQTTGALDLATLKAIAEGPQDAEQVTTKIGTNSSKALVWLAEEGLVMTGLRPDLATRTYQITILGRIILSHFDKGDWGDWLTEQRLLRVYRAATRLLRDPHRATEWLREPNMRLNGAMPLEAVHSEAATSEVEAEVLRIQHGVY